MSCAWADEPAVSASSAAATATAARATWFELLDDAGFVDVRAVTSPYADETEGVGAESFVGRRPA